MNDLRDTKVGDSVYLSSGFGDSVSGPFRVDIATPTQIGANGKRYMRRSGKEIGSYSPGWLITAEDAAGRAKRRQEYAERQAAQNAARVESLVEKLALRGLTLTGDALANAAKFERELQAIGRVLDTVPIVGLTE